MRKRRAVKRDVLPDPIFHSKVVTKLVNQIMVDGKRGKAETIVYDAFDINTSREVDNFFGNRMGFDIDEYLVEDCQEDLTI